MTKQMPEATLTATQKQRSASLRGFFEDENAIIKIVSHLEPRGENSWKRTYDKIAAIGRGDYKQQMYFDTLYDNFIIGQVVSPDEIIKIVVSVRHEMDMPPYLTSLKKNCELDFMRLFMVQTVYQEVGNDSDANTEKPKKTITGYIPTVRLKPEEN